MYWQDMSHFEKHDFYKWPNAPNDYRWQWVFPQENRWKNTKNSEEAPHHVEESIIYTYVLRKEATGVRTPIDGLLPSLYSLYNHCYALYGEVTFGRIIYFINMEATQMASLDHSQKSV